MTIRLLITVAVMVSFFCLCTCEDQSSSLDLPFSISYEITGGLSGIVDSGSVKSPDVDDRKRKELVDLINSLKLLRNESQSKPLNRPDARRIVLIIQADLVYKIDAYENPNNLELFNNCKKVAAAVKDIHKK